MFVARMCLLLGKGRDELLSQVSSQELTWWMAVDRIQPLPDSYWQAGLIASTIANCHSKKRYKVQDFMPSTRPNWQVHKEQFRLWAVQHNKRIADSG